MNYEAHGKGHEQREDEKLETILKYTASTYPHPYSRLQTKVLVNGWWWCSSFYLKAIEVLSEEILDTLPSGKGINFYFLWMTKNNTIES